MPLTDDELLLLQVDILHLQGHQFAEPNPTADQQQEDGPLQDLVQDSEEAVDLLIAQRAGEGLRLHQVGIRANRGGL